MVWDPLSGGNPSYSECGGPCQVVYDHDGGSYRVRAYGKTWEEALAKARIPLQPNAEPAGVVPADTEGRQERTSGPGAPNTPEGSSSCPA